MSTSTYPVHVEAQLDADLSRWQWLVKWILVIPHYVVLFFLWAAFVVLSLVAFVAILFTGRYPRTIFDFNVGVLRWTWRVSYYAYGALGTDKYPPFSLQERPDYPAHLEIDYPDHLSRGLVLVKWWLLAIPHYLVLGLLLGGAGYLGRDAGRSGEEAWGWSPGLIGLLVLFAGVALLFTGRYPRQIFDFVLGLNRWVLRVAAYAALMTDRYPPFRLDQGGSDPATASFSTAPATTQTPTPAPAKRPVTGASGSGPDGGRPTPTSRWTAGRVLGVLVATGLLLGSLAVTMAGVGAAAVDQTLRDDAGYVMTSEDRFSTDTFAIASESMEIHTDPPADFLPGRLLGEAKLTAAPAGDGAIFIGLGPTPDVERYLAGVEHAVLTEYVDSTPVYRVSGEGPPATAPTEQEFWVAQASGTDEQSITWEVENGDWSVVLMNAEGSAGVDAEVAAGATVPGLTTAAVVLISAGVLGLVFSVVVLVMVVRSARA